VETGFQTIQSDGRLARGRRAFVGALVLFLSLALLAGCHRDPNVRKQKYFESGQRYSTQGKQREAAIQFSNAVKIDKNFADAYYARSKAYLQMGALSAAYSDLQKTVQLAPSNLKARVDLGNMLLAGGKIDEAQAQANAVLGAQPDNADAHALLARVAARKGQSDVALAEINRALAIAPNEAALHETMALLEVNDPTKVSNVEAELKKSVALDPKAVNAKLLLAAFYVKSNRLQDAEQISWSAVAADPRSLSARENLAQIILRENDPARTEQVLRQASSDLSDDPQGVRLLADYYTSTGQIEKAKGEFANLSRKYSKNLNVQEGYVRILLDTKDFATAQTVIGGLMKTNGKDPQVAVLNGIVLLNNGKTDDAINALQTAANDAPKDAFIQFWLGKAALAKGNAGLAESSFRLAAQLKPSEVEAQEELAHIASQRGDITMLNGIAEKTIATAPRYPGGYLWRASVEMTRNQMDKAEADLNSAISVAPRGAQAYLMLGELRYTQKRYPESQQLLQQALQNDPNSVAALRGLVRFDLMQKHPDQALARLNAQIAKSPKNSAFLDLLASFQFDSKNFDQAAVTAQQAMQLNPNDGEAVAIYAQLQVARGQAANAIGAWQRWSQAHPTNAGALALLGMLEEAAGDKGKAQDYYQKALQIDPEQPIASNNLAYMMLENGGNLDVALSLAETSRRAMPNSPNSADTLAWAYYYKGTYGFARDLLEDAVKNNPNSASMHYHLGMVYSKLKDKPDAITHLKKAISLSPDSPTAAQAKTALQGLG
jgi:tetratricopeptide (TPR) repeat protein